MKKITRPILFAIIVIISIIFLKYKYSHYLNETNSGIGGYRKTVNCELLFIGSSQTRQDYNIRSIDSITELSSYCLAYDGLQPVFIAEIIQFLTQTSFSPKYIIMEAYPYLSIQEPAIADSRLFSDAAPELKEKLISPLKKNNTFKHNQWFELYVRRENEAMLMYPITFNYKNTLSYKGSYQNKIVEGMGTFVTHEKANQNTIDRMELNKFQKNAHFQLIEMCKTKNIKIIYICPPVAEPIHNSPNYKNSSELLYQYINDSLNTTYLNGSEFVSIMEPSNFADYFHLSTRGREIYSISIAEKLSAILNE